MNDKAVQEIWFKGQRVIRTAFQWLVGSIAPIVALIGYANELWPTSWLGIALVIGGGIQTYLAKIMANDTVNNWLSTHTFLGSVPKSVATQK